MQEERWMKIEGSPKYSVSDRGQVRNDVTGKMLRSNLNDCGYYFVNLCNNGKRKTHKVHRLVAIAFCERTNENTEVDHIDQNKTNNHYENLRWVSSSNNQRNKRKRAGTSSHFTCVSWYKKTKKWYASISLNKKRKHIGYFDTEEAAHHAFRAEVSRLHLEEYYPLEDKANEADDEEEEEEEEEEEVA